jgi:hypothetical protein
MTTIPIPLSAQTLTRCTVPTLDKDREITFLIAVPTAVTRETLGLRLFELGAVQVSQEALRACAINELFEIYPEDEADKRADFLNGFYEQDDITTEQIRLWQIREAERLIDEAKSKGKVKRPAEPAPKPMFSVRDRYRAQGIVDDIIVKSDLYRSMLANRVDWARQQTAMTVRLAIKGVEDDAFDLAFVPAGLDQEQILSDDTVDEIRRAIGPVGWKTLTGFIDEQYGLSRSEEKNSASPAENEHDQSGSAGSTEDGEGSNGASPPSTTGTPTSSTTPTPSTASGTTIEKSSRTGSATKRPTRNTGQTVEA